MVVKKNKKNLRDTCFLITPIGSEKSETRERVNQWESKIYEPALNNNYEIIRADKISAPGVITEQIIQHIVDADLVIIDYTELNPNVMYESAIRHLIAKPYIQIYEAGIRLPFDIHNLRSISYDKFNLSYPSKLIADIQKCLKEIKNSKYKQPQLLKEKFDFNKIISDPEEFARQLSKYIIPNNKQKGANDTIIRIAEHDSRYVTLGRKKIVCPKCKTIKYENNSLLASDSLDVDYYNSPMFSGHHYKCNNCGTEFDS